MNLWRRLVDRLSNRPTEGDVLRNLQPLLSEAHTLIKAEQYDEARPVLFRALEFRDSTQDGKIIDWILTSLGSTWLLQDKFDEEIAFFSEYLSHHPADSAAYRERASALWYLDRLGDAVEDYSRAIGLEPTDLLSRSGRGQVFAELGDSARAIEDLDIALRVLESAPKPDASWSEWYKSHEAFIRRGRAVALAKSGQLPKAMNEFEKSIALCADNAWAYYSRAQAYYGIGDKARALSDYNTALTKSSPPLTPSQKESARARVSALTGD